MFHFLLHPIVAQLADLCQIVRFLLLLLDFYVLNCIFANKSNISVEVDRTEGRTEDYGKRR